MDQNRNRGSPRLLFSKEELDNPALSRPAKKAAKAADKYEAAQKKLPTRHRLRLTREEIETGQAAVETADAEPAMPQSPAAASKATGQSSLIRSPESPKVPNAAKNTGSLVPNPQTSTAKTKSKDAVTQRARKKAVRLRFEEEQVKNPSRMIHPTERTVGKVHDQLHRQLSEANEDDNSAMDAVLQGDQLSESALRMGEHTYYAHKFRPYRKAEQAEKALDQANIRYLQAKQRDESPRFSSSPLSRWQQKRAIRREYMAAKAGRSSMGGTEYTAKAAQKAAHGTETATKKIADYFGKHPTALMVILLSAMLLVVMSSLQSCSPLVQFVLESIVIGTYPAEDDDVLAAERAYAAKERELQDEMERYEQYHPGYDEYHVEAAEIWHDPYVLIAIISAYFDGQEWTLESVYPVIEKYFNLQYVVTQTITTETRYRTEPTTGTQIVTDPVTGEQHTESYTYGVQVPYTYSICNVKLENKNLSHLPVVSMSHHTMGMYALYMASHGNMEGIFSGNPHAVPLKDPMLYDIPQETLDADPSFAALMEEATKYIGYPYVWGGASPETSFDCSGFVSYVFSNSGVYNTGRLGAKGLRSLCRDVPEEQAKPGDIVFFDGTMGEDVAGITHCGIYVGNHKMLHCGSPIGYADLTDSYWQTHFHSFGRVPN